MKFLTFSFCLFYSCFVNSQEQISAEFKINDFKSDRYIYFPESEIQFKDYGEKWFSTVVDLVNLNEIPPLSNNPWGQKALLVSVFPDSTIIMSIDPITKKSFRPSVYGMADIINPSKTPSQWASQWVDVIIDSISIPYVYTRATSVSIIDTLFVDYIKSRPDNFMVYYDLDNDNSPGDGEFLHQPLYHTDASTNQLDTGQIFRTDTILLTSNDGSSSDDILVKFKNIDVNDVVLREERYGIYIRFSPGYEWELSDNINDFNEFFLLTREQKENELPRQIWPLTAGFCSYTMSKNVRYNGFSNSLSYSLIPGIYPSPSWKLEHLMISYKFTSNNLSTNTLKNDLTFKVFPNPVVDVVNIRVTSSNIENIELFIFDITGKVVFKDLLVVNSPTGSIYSFNLKSLKSGVYSIKIGELFGKFVVK